jgi:hypothetical protein
MKKLGPIEPDPRWRKAFESPLCRLPDGSEAPREIGYRAMMVFQGASDSAPALYVSTKSNLGSLMLRSDDGARFVPVSPRGFTNREILAFRSLVPFGKRLFTSPTGRTNAKVLERDGMESALNLETILVNRNVAESPIVLGNSDPAVAP